MNPLPGNYHSGWAQYFDTNTGKCKVADCDLSEYGMPDLTNYTWASNADVDLMLRWHGVPGFGNETDTEPYSISQGVDALDVLMDRFAPTYRLWSGPRIAAYTREGGIPPDDCVNEDPPCIQPPIHPGQLIISRCLLSQRDSGGR